MPFDWTEAIQDVPQVIALVQKIEAQVKLLPKPPVPLPPGGAPVKPLFDLAAAILPELGALVDVIKAQAAD